MSAAFQDRLAALGLDLIQPLRAAWFDGPLPGGFGPDSLAFVVGNGRALWEPFLSWARERPGLPHPLDAYVTESIHAACQLLEPRHAVAFGHKGPPFVPIQRIAQAAGLAWLSPSHLSIHPRLGPWLGLRAVVAVDLPGPPGPGPEMERPCHACDQACLPALAKARAAPPSPDASAFLAVRDACPMGIEHRYGEAQIRYHYVKDPQVLARPQGSDGQ